MIPNTNTNYNALVPINRASLSVDMADRFGADAVNLYSAFSIYGNNGTGPGQGIGFQQPYVWAGLNDSDVWKYIKKYDNFSFPEGSTVQDIQRVGEFMASGTGLAFEAIQIALQEQNAFNETRTWNPLSILEATGQQGSLGLISSNPPRHIEGGSGGLISTILNGVPALASVINQSYSGKGPIQGTARKGLDALSLEVQENGGWAAKGLTRYATANAAQNRFVKKFPSNGQTTNGTSQSTNFLSSIGNSIISTVVDTILGTTTPQAYWDYRVEYSDKINVYQGFQMDDSDLLLYSVNGVDYSPLDVNPYYPGTASDPGSNKDKSHWYQTPYYTMNQSVNPSSIIVLSQTLLADGTYDITKAYDKNDQAWEPLGNKPDDISLTSMTSKTNPTIGVGGATANLVDKILGPDNVTRITNAVTKWNQSKVYSPIDASFYKSWVKTYPQVIATHNASGNSLPTYLQSIKDKSSVIDTSAGKDFAAQFKADGYNQLNPIYESDGQIPDELKSSTGGNSKDIIFFYFFDVVNSVYIPFRATITGLNESTGVEWEDFQYIGRADKLYMYKGFTREVNFIFSVYANSVSEMEPMWRRINYLNGLTRPANYTTNSTTNNSTSASPSNNGTGNFIYPPMIKFRIGDLYVDQPAVLRNMGLTVPDDAVWETQRSGYTFKNGVLASTSNVAQLPMKVDISISMALIEKEKSKTQALHYFDNSSAGFDLVSPVSSARDKAALQSDATQAASLISQPGSPNLSLPSVPTTLSSYPTVASPSNAATSTGAVNLNVTAIDTVTPPGGVPPNTNLSSF